MTRVPVIAAGARDSGHGGARGVRASVQLRPPSSVKTRDVRVKKQE
jgi:hypothetical protein